MHHNPKKYIHAIPGAFAALLCAIIADILVPHILEPTGDVAIILTIATFLFGIFAGFFISRLSARYSEVRQLVAQEDALFLSLYKTSQLIGRPFARQMAELIDRYYIVSFDFPLSAYPYKLTASYYLAMWDLVRRTKPKQNIPAYQWMLEELTEIERQRNTAAATLVERLGRGNWAMMIFLAIIILTSVYYIRTDALYSHFISIILSTVLVLTLLLMRDLQNLLLGGNVLLEESGEEIFEFIGRPRYYQQKNLESGYSKIPSHVTNYRIGLHTPGSLHFRFQKIHKKPSAS